MVNFPSPQERFPEPVYSETASGPPSELEAFINSKTKIAIQRDGELTDLSRKIFLEEFDIRVPMQRTDSRVLVSASEDGEFGYMYSRNKDICGLVASGAVDMAIVGMDRLIEDQAEETVEVVAEFSDRALWPLVLAAPANGGVTSFDEIKRIATKYPLIAARYLEQFNPAIEISQVAGGTEIYPYLSYNGDRIDGIIDMSVTGNSLRAHGLVAWNPPVAQIYPVLIRAKQQERGA